MEKRLRKIEFGLIENCPDGNNNGFYCTFKTMNDNSEGGWIIYIHPDGKFFYEEWDECEYSHYDRVEGTYDSSRYESLENLTYQFDVGWVHQMAYDYQNK